MLNRRQARWAHFLTRFDFKITIREDLKTDAFTQAILAQIDPSRTSCSQSQPPGTDYRQFKYCDGLLFFKELLYVPNGSCRLRVVQNCHDTYTARHFGSTKTLDLVQRSFWWPRMRQFVEDFVRTCDTCCKAKMPRHHPYGLLEPLPIPSKPWQSIALDFIMDLPVSKGFDAI